MAQPTTREEFKQFCLRKLGHPVIQINVSDEQIDDRIDEAFSFWSDYHYNGSQMIYLKHQLTEEDISNGYVEVPPQLLGVTRIFDLSSSISTGSGMFNVTYQYVLNNISSLTGVSITDYYLTMQNLRFIQEWLVGWPMIRYNRHVNRVYIDQDSSKLTPGNYVIFEAYDIISPERHPEVWQDRFFQNYCTALIKEQWGANLTKFTNMQMVGGVMFNGEQILMDGREERRILEDEAKSSLQPLVYNFTG
jgi:hypothetical protein